VLYRLVFGGVAAAPKGELVLWSLPQVWLEGPFASIHLFGVMTVENVVEAASSALVFASIIIVFAAANTLADPRDLLDRAPKRLASIAWSISVALSVFPLVISSATRIRVARRLRAERSVTSLIVPLLEQSIERSEQLGLSMAMRGFGGAKQRGASASASVSANGLVLRLDAVSASIAGEVIVREATFEAHPGTVTVITGPTGSGKTGVLRLLRGAFTEATGGTVSGCATLGDAPVTLNSPIALTLQRPEHSFVAATVRAEIAFAGVQQGIDAFVSTREIARTLGIEPILDRPIETLSAGEAALVSIAAALATNPQVLLLDEPVADLDAAAVERVIDALRSLRDHANTTIVIAEHRPEPLFAIADRRYHLSDGVLISDEIPKSVAPSTRATRPVALRQQALVTLCDDLSVRRGDVEVIHEVTLAVHPSAITALVGPNGCGKTTLLESLALVGGKPADGIVMVSHSVDDMLFRRTLTDECRANDRNAKLPMGSTEASIRRFLPGIGSFNRHPRDCSAGTRVVLAIAMQLARSSCVLLLDEPTRGLDATARAELADALLRATAAGNAVLLATHDEEFAAATAHHTVRMHAGRIIDESLTLDAPREHQSLRAADTQGAEA
jgi:energy-coupling factor transport system ATP-binding protein